MKQVSRIHSEKKKLVYCSLNHPTNVYCSWCYARHRRCSSEHYKNTIHDIYSVIRKETLIKEITWAKYSLCSNKYCTGEGGGPWMVTCGPALHPLPACPADGHPAVGSLLSGPGHLLHGEVTTSPSVCSYHAQFPKRSSMWVYFRQMLFVESNPWSPVLSM